MAGLAPEGRRGRALAIATGGLTVAAAVGVPVGALVAAAAGRPATFLAVTAAGAIARIGLVRALPHLPQVLAHDGAWRRGHGGRPLGTGRTGRRPGFRALGDRAHRRRRLAVGTGRLGIAVPVGHRLIDLAPRAPTVVLALNASALDAGMAAGGLLGGAVLELASPARTEKRARARRPRARPGRAPRRRERTDAVNVLFARDEPAHHLRALQPQG